ncbi:MAG: polysaccharide deacetylase family protein [Lachnospiraceae bacterium]|nr:polysaccharide deacetylase family protein [Lachnospiraceae bacterium]
MGRKEQRRVRKSVRVGRIRIVKVLILAAAALILYVPLFAGYKARAAAANGMVDSKKIAITFDDGPHPYYTEQLLDGLKEREVKATFFVTGKHVEQYPELIERMYEEGHLIGNHTYSHLQLNRNNGETFKEELIKTNELIEEVTGQEVQYVRPPYGSWDKKFEKELNMFPVLWNIDPLDWCSDNVACIVQKVTSKAKENSIILMHDEYKSTVTAALQIIDALQKEGYEFVTVDEILFD